MVHTTPFITVQETPVVFPNGQSGAYSRVNPGTFGGVVIPRRVVRGIAEFGLVQQHRFAIDRVTYEFPRGGTRDLGAGEALRELIEETGIFAEASAAISLGTIHADTGLLATTIGVWLLSVQQHVAGHVEAETGARTRWVSRGELAHLVASDALTCGISLAALSKLNASSFAVAPGEVL